MTEQKLESMGYNPAAIAAIMDIIREGQKARKEGKHD